MVEFLQRVEDGEICYEVGSRHFDLPYGEDIILVRQPNSPDNKNWWTEFRREHEGVIFRTLPIAEMSLGELTLEDRLLRL